MINTYLSLLGVKACFKYWSLKMAVSTSHLDFRISYKGSCVEHKEIRLFVM